jgi:hypothetical protein
VGECKWGGEVCVCGGSVSGGVRVGGVSEGGVGGSARGRGECKGEGGGGLCEGEGGCVRRRGSV